MSGPGPWLILHRAGELTPWETARACRADRLEVDVRLRGGHAEVRHDTLWHPALPRLQRGRFHLPRWRLRPVPLEGIAPPGRLFLDLKEDSPGLLDAVLGALPGDGLAVSTPHWNHLDRLVERAPDVLRFYSVGRPRHDPERRWRAYAERLRAGDGRWLGDGVSLHYLLATPERLDRLRAAGLRAICYTVNDLAAAQQLLGGGAGGITTDRIDLVDALRG